MKQKKLWMLAAILIISGAKMLASCSNSDKPSEVNTTVLTEWQAGRTVSQEAVEAFGGIEKCFAAEPIPDDVWARMQGKTYKENPYIGRGDLRHIRALHWDYDQQMHVGEMVCNAKIADRVVSILRQLFDAKYPIQRMLLPDVYDADDEAQMRDNNSSCFCYRNIAATNNLSKHARGLAIDINTLYNPYIKTLNDGTLLIQPATGEPYCDRTWDFPYKIDHDDLCFKLFTEAGFGWGGDWTTRKDYSCSSNEEIPSQVAAGIADEASRCCPEFSYASIVTLKEKITIHKNIDRHENYSYDAFSAVRSVVDDRGRPAALRGFV